MINHNHHHVNGNDPTRAARAVIPGEVVNLHDAPSLRKATAGPGQESSSGREHFEVALDADPTPGGGRVDTATTPKTATRRPIIPAHLSGWVNIKDTIKIKAGHSLHVSGYHAIRAPGYATLALFWATVGVFRLGRRQVAWWWLADEATLRKSVAASGDPQMWLNLHKQMRHTRKRRGLVLVGQVLAVTVGVPLFWLAAPPALVVLACAGAVAGLARLGRPDDRRIVSPAVVTGRYRRVNPDIILRAYYAAGLGHPDKEHLKVGFGSTMARDATGTGSQVIIDLPYGKTYGDAIKARGAIASGLDVAESQVFITRDKSSHRRHVLFVADRDPLADGAGRTPMLDGKQRDIWSPVELGLDERGRKVTLALMWVSVLVGAQPRKGKTFAARLLALHAALDPYVRLTVVDGKNSPDWAAFKLVAHRLICGTMPNGRDNDPVTHLLEALREIKAHIEEVNDFLATLAASLCPEGKITPELSRKFPQLRVWMLVMEEFQVYYELDDQEANKEIAGLLSFIMAVGPSAGVIILSSSQKPSGVGSGDVQRLFNRYRDNHAVRFALKCGNRLVSEAILGGDAYSEGFDASALPNGLEYRGVGILFGAADETPIVRTYLADQQNAEHILAAARRHRERIGTLSGLGAGETLTRQSRDVLADVRSMFEAGEPGLPWSTLAPRMTKRMPEHYADLTAEAISAQLRAHVPSVNVKVRGVVSKGARLADLEAAITRRATG